MKSLRYYIAFVFSLASLYAAFLAGVTYDNNGTNMEFWLLGLLAILASAISEAILKHAMGHLK
jgi:hypothetical protein